LLNGEDKSFVVKILAMNAGGGGGSLQTPSSEPLHKLLFG
jgi:hypothetical protein